jgi:hypothetical protein
MLEGNVGLLFTNEEPASVREWFGSFSRADFARSGNKVDEGFELPAGTFTHPIPPRGATTNDGCFYRTDIDERRPRTSLHRAPVP